MGLRIGSRRLVIPLAAAQSRGGEGGLLKRRWRCIQYLDEVRSVRVWR
jgi:hypothetical protein